MSHEIINKSIRELDISQNYVTGYKEIRVIYCETAMG